MSQVLVDKLRVVNHFVSIPPEVLGVDTCAREGPWRDLSPFVLPAGPLYGPHRATNVENAWQYSKVYQCHLGHDGEPAATYWSWAQAGWANPRAVRYPMGKGAKPAYALWKGQHLGYVDARIQIYMPLYARAVTRTAAFSQLADAYQSGREIWLRDFDGWDHIAAKLSPTQVIHRTDKKVGHGFVLWLLLTKFEQPGLFESSLWAD